MPLKVELFELCKSAKAKKTNDLSSKIVAEVAFGPRSLEGSAVVDSGGHPL